LSFLATFVNPSGWRLWETSLGYVRNRYLVGHTAEYLPPNFHEPSTWPFALMIVLSILLLARGRERVPAVYTLLLAGWTALGLYSVRNVPIYALLAAPLLAEVSAGQARDWGGFRQLNERLGLVEARLKGYVWPVIVVLLAALALAGGARLDFRGQGNRFDPAGFPVKAVDWLEENPQPGNGFNYFPWGGYLLYRMWPEQRVFIDGQTDFYGEALTRQYEQVITLDEGWREVLAGYQVQWALMPAGSALAQALQDEPGWRAIYMDETSAVLRHEP
jgi:hypothetical protein